MKRIIPIFILLVLLTVPLSNGTYAQLPFEPFVTYSGNPVLPSDPGSWDEYAIWWPSVTFVNDTFYIIYNGTDNIFTTPMSLGLATSDNGFNYEKSSTNPILSGDGIGFDAYSVANGVLVFSNSTWYLYYTGRSLGPNQPGNVIGRALSIDSPHGPWIHSNDTLLAVGSPGEWDSEFVGPEVIIENGSQLIMYYWAGDIWPAAIPQIGMATSSNGGLTWEKYNDPTTNLPPYVESDPVLKPDKFYDILGIWGCTVLRRDSLWEMFYSGKAANEFSISYATSLDGVNWVKDRDSLNNPIFTPSQDPIATNIVEKPSVVTAFSLYYMYYDYEITPNGIGLATANIPTAPAITITPTTLNFGEVGINSDSTMIFTRINSGNADLNVTDISSSEPAFTIDTTNTIIPPGNDQDVEVTFKPTEEILYNGIIEIVHNALGSPDSVTVTGSGIIAGLEDGLLNTIPTEFVVYQNFPNPFNPSTLIIFGLPEAGEVKLTLFNFLGQEVANIFEGYSNAGYHRVEFDASRLPSGIYFYRLQAENFIQTKKMILLK
jgi:predicted GH43/DUF377 family glycosyl hydrolase